MERVKGEKEERDKEFFENWQTSERGYPPIKGDLPKKDQKMEKLKVYRTNQENYLKNIEDKLAIKDIYRNNPYATTTQVFND